LLIVTINLLYKIITQKASVLEPIAID